MPAKKDILGIETKRRIFDHIQKHPGLHLRQLSKELETPLTTLKYHLKFLIKHDLISEQSENKYFRYYVKDSVGNGDKRTLPFLRQKVSLNIILYLLLMVGASQIELSRSLKKHPTTIEFHLKKMMDAGIVERLPSENGVITIPRSDNIKYLEYAPVSNEAVYKLSNPIALYETIIVYKNSFFDDALVTSVIGLIEDAVAEGRIKKLPKKTIKRNLDKRVEKGMEYIYDIFPHPYHV